MSFGGGLGVAQGDHPWLVRGGGRTPGEKAPGAPARIQDLEPLRMSAKGLQQFHGVWGAAPGDGVNLRHELGEGQSGGGTASKGRLGGVEHGVHGRPRGGG